MSDKQIDMSVFIGQDFDCEFVWTEWLDRGKPWEVGCLGRIRGISSPTFDLLGGDFYELCRPRLNHWNFNDGSMVLPDGLVTDKRYPYGGIIRSYSGDSLSYHVSGNSDYAPVAVKIIGVHPDYSEWGKVHGMEVVEL